MKSSVTTKENIKVDATDEILVFGLKTGAIICALIGAWALCGLAAAFIQSGPVEVLKGYITAITGM